MDLCDIKYQLDENGYAVVKDIVSSSQLETLRMVGSNCHKGTRLTVLCVFRVPIK